MLSVSPFAAAGIRPGRVNGVKVSIPARNPVTRFALADEKNTPCRQSWRITKIRRRSKPAGTVSKTDTKGVFWRDKTIQIHRAA
jgi:hypothetical protein